MSLKNFIALTLVMLLQINSFAQSKKSLSTINNDDNIVMTWNKNTPESEMKDDSKALAEKGITIKYSNVKRNSNKEITAIKVEYADRQGNKGTLELNNQKPISTINFFKVNGEIGFGQPSNSANDMFASNPFFQGMPGGQDFMKQFNFGNDNDDNSHSYSFSFPDKLNFGDSMTRIQIQKDGKKPLVIENGEVIEGGEDYTPEEIEKIKSENKIESFGFNGDNLNNKEFDFRNQDGLDNFKKKMDEMKIEMEKKFSNKSDFEENKSDFDKTKEEMLKAKDEMNKAKEELEQAKKDLEKAKSSIKTRKA